MDLRGLSRKLGIFAVDMSRVSQHGVERAAKLIQKSAKEAIWTYEFGWPQLKDSTQDIREAQGYARNEPLLRTGALRNSIETTVGHHEAWVGTNDPKAAWMEFGTSKADPRPFIGGALNAKRDELKKLFVHGVAPAVRGQAPDDTDG